MKDNVCLYFAVVITICLSIILFIVVELVKHG